MNSRHLIDRFEAAQREGEALVLVTVFATAGSTYSKAGTRMLITAGGDSQGLISGGCLEGDLALRARAALQSSAAQTVTYDLRDEAVELFGLGIGCNGLIEVLLQPLRPESAWEPMRSIAEALMGETAGALATIIDPGSAEATPGSGLAVVNGEMRVFGLREPWLGPARDACIEAVTGRRSALVAGPGGGRMLVTPLVPIPRVLVLGAGLDAVPLVNVLAELGWRVTLADHRPAYLSRPGFERAEQRRAVSPPALALELASERFDAIVIMSHHLDTDREYLRQLAGIERPYIGLLGPPARRHRLLGELGAAAGSLAARLRGPVGIDIGADNAESIALSIAAEIQDVLARTVGPDPRR